MPPECARPRAQQAPTHLSRAKVPRRHYFQTTLRPRPGCRSCPSTRIQSPKAVRDARWAHLVLTTTTKAGGHVNRNAGFIRQTGEPHQGCRTNPAFRRAIRFRQAPMLGVHGRYASPIASCATILVAAERCRIIISLWIMKTTGRRPLPGPARGVAIPAQQWRCWPPAHLNAHREPL